MSWIGICWTHKNPSVIRSSLFFPPSLKGIVYNRRYRKKKGKNWNATWSSAGSALDFPICTRRAWRKRERRYYILWFMDDVGNTCQTPLASQSFPPSFAFLTYNNIKYIFTAFFVITEYYLLRSTRISAWQPQTTKESAAARNISLCRVCILYAHPDSKKKKKNPPDNPSSVFWKGFTSPSILPTLYTLFLSSKTRFSKSDRKDFLSFYFFFFFNYNLGFLGQLYYYLGFDLFRA